MDSVANFRDLGGIKNRAGKTIRKKRLLRSGELTGLSDTDQRILADEYGLLKVVDFRLADEAKRSPDRLPQGVEYFNIDIIKNAHKYATSFSQFESIRSIKQVHGYMCKSYEMMTMDEGAQEGYAAFIKHALSMPEEGSLLFHCFAGKDRTGIAAAILLTLLDVSEEEIFKDYMKTNEERAAANKEILSREKHLKKSEEELAVLQSFLLVEKEYLEYAFDTVCQKYGSFLEYIRQALAVTDEDIAKMQELYLV
ncbi:MAG: tyrosine-protein phosphatase [Christensenellaceae bacterium]